MQFEKLIFRFAPTKWDKFSANSRAKILCSLRSHMFRSQVIRSLSLTLSFSLYKDHKSRWTALVQSCLPPCPSHPHHQSFKKRYTALSFACLRSPFCCGSTFFALFRLSFRREIVWVCRNTPLCTETHLLYTTRHTLVTFYSLSLSLSLSRGECNIDVAQGCSNMGIHSRRPGKSVHEVKKQCLMLHMKENASCAVASVVQIGKLTVYFYMMYVFCRLEMQKFTTKTEEK